MTSSITAAAVALQSAVAAAAPLSEASSATITGLQEQAENLRTLVASAIPNSAGALDGPDPAGMPPVIIAQLQALFISASGQSALSDMLGFIGRAEANLNEIGV